MTYPGSRSPTIRRLPPRVRPTTGRVALLASGDFACNLYWQSASLFLLFFYTDVLRLPPGLAGLLYMGGMLWDGVADLMVGIVIQHRALPYRRVVAWGAVPLGIAFAGLYRPEAGLAWIIVGQIAFRTLYAVVNVPYIAWSARISDDSRDRTLLAGLRMLFGTAAAVLVSLGTPALADAGAADGRAASGYFVAATAFAAIGITLLMVVARTAPEAVQVRGARIGVPSIRGCARALLANRAFVTLNAAAMASAVAATILGQSVLYYFSHVVGDPAAGPHALAMMGVAGAVAVPIWMWVTGRTGTRSAWFLAIVIGLAALLAFGCLGGAGRIGATLFLVVMQMALTGFHLGFWAMLPDTVEYGERMDGLRVEAMAFGAAALLQKIALAAATGLLGLFYDRIGYTGGNGGAAVTIEGIRWLMIAGPAAGLVVSAATMLANPLKRGVHARIVADLARANVGNV